jgi:hypothetical protein
MSASRWKVGALTLVIVFAAVIASYASEWSIFWPLDRGVSVSYASVDSTTYTWKFRNDGYDTIKYMKFEYSYIDATTGRYETDSDVFPGSLSPGETFGGWTAFTAHSRIRPTIRITEIERR